MKIITVNILAIFISNFLFFSPSIFFRYSSFCNSSSSEGSGIASFVSTRTVSKSCLSKIAVLEPGAYLANFTKSAVDNTDLKFFKVSFEISN